MREKAGFTLVEILIVVAIIAVVAAIAVPNIMSANIRAKVSGVRSDMGSIAIALEDYKVDHGTYPIEPESDPYRTTGIGPDEIGEAGQSFDGTGGNDNNGNDAIGLGYLVYPVTSFNPTYLKRIPGDPFNNNGEEDWDGNSGAHNHHYCYFTGKSISGGRVNSEFGDTEADYWALASYGPDKDQDVYSYIEAWNAVDPNASNPDPSKAYDSDRGITSSGDIIIIGP